MECTIPAPMLRSAAMVSVATCWSCHIVATVAAVFPTVLATHAGSGRGMSALDCQFWCSCLHQSFTFVRNTEVFLYTVCICWLDLH
jgi:hypothetical protein